MGRYSRTGRSKRVTERDRASMDVHAFARKRELALYGACLGGERLVYFDEVHVIHAQPSLGEGRLRSRDRSDTHHRRIYPGNAPRNQTAERFELPVTCKFLTGDDHRRGAVTDTGSIAGGDYAALSKHRLESRQTFRCRL